MKSQFRIVVGALFGYLALAGFNEASAQQPRRDAPRSRERIESRTRTESRARSSTQIFRSSLLVGSSVALQGGTTFGDVEEFVFSPDGCLEYVIVAYEDRYYPVPWSIASFHFDDRVVILDADVGLIQQAPAFSDITEITQISNTKFVEKVRTHYRVKERSVQPRPDREDRRGIRQTEDPGKAGDERPSRGAENGNESPDADRPDAEKPSAEKPKSEKPNAEKPPAPEKPEAKKPADPKKPAPKPPADPKKPSDPKLPKG